MQKQQAASKGSFSSSQLILGKSGRAKTRSKLNFFFVCSWGRIGSNNPGRIESPYQTADEAIERFMNSYKEKTGLVFTGRGPAPTSSAFKKNRKDESSGGAGYSDYLPTSAALKYAAGGSNGSSSSSNSSSSSPSAAAAAVPAAPAAAAAEGSGSSSSSSSSDSDDGAARKKAVNNKKRKPIVRKPAAAAANKKKKAALDSSSSSSSSDSSDSEKDASPAKKGTTTAAVAASTAGNNKKKLLKKKAAAVVDSSSSSSSEDDDDKPKQAATAAAAAKTPAPKAATVVQDAGKTSSTKKKAAPTTTAARIITLGPSKPLVDNEGDITLPYQRAYHRYQQENGDTTATGKLVAAAASASSTSASLSASTTTSSASSYLPSEVFSMMECLTDPRAILGSLRNAGIDTYRVKLGGTGLSQDLAKAVEVLSKLGKILSNSTLPTGTAVAPKDQAKRQQQLSDLSEDLMLLFPRPSSSDNNDTITSTSARQALLTKLGLTSSDVDTACEALVASIPLQLAPLVDDDLTSDLTAPARYDYESRAMSKRGVVGMMTSSTSGSGSVVSISTRRALSRAVSMLLHLASADSACRTLRTIRAKALPSLVHPVDQAYLFMRHTLRALAGSNNSSSSARSSPYDLITRMVQGTTESGTGNSIIKGGFIRGLQVLGVCEIGEKPTSMTTATTKATTNNNNVIASPGLVTTSSTSAAPSGSSPTSSSSAAAPIQSLPNKRLLWLHGIGAGGAQAGSLLNLLVHGFTASTMPDPSLPSSGFPFGRGIYFTSVASAAAAAATNGPLVPERVDSLLLSHGATSNNSGGAGSATSALMAEDKGGNEEEDYDGYAPVTGPPSPQDLELIDKVLGRTSPGSTTGASTSYYSTETVLMLCEVACGREHRTTTRQAFLQLPDGCHCIRAVGRVTPSPTGDEKVVVVNTADSSTAAVMGSTGPLLDVTSATSSASSSDAGSSSSSAQALPAGRYGDRSLSYSDLSRSDSLHDTYVIADTSQIQPKYLVRVKVKVELPQEYRQALKREVMTAMTATMTGSAAPAGGVPAALVARAPSFVGSGEEEGEKLVGDGASSGSNSSSSSSSSSSSNGNNVDIDALFDEAIAETAAVGAVGVFTQQQQLPSQAPAVAAGTVAMEEDERQKSQKEPQQQQQMEEDDNDDFEGFSAAQPDVEEDRQAPSQPSQQQQENVMVVQLKMPAKGSTVAAGGAPSVIAGVGAGALYAETQMAGAGGIEDEFLNEEDAFPMAPSFPAGNEASQQPQEQPQQEGQEQPSIKLTKMSKAAIPAVETLEAAFEFDAEEAGMAMAMAEDDDL
jgi:WGR domain